MKKISKKYIVFTLLIFVVGIIIGKSFSSTNEEENTHVHELHDPTEYTCSMHPQIRQNEPGDCPICGMDLIPVADESGGSESVTLKMSKTALQLAQISTLVVQKDSKSKSLQLEGKIEFDERQIVTQPAHIPGRIEKLSVSFTGEYVRKGDVLAQIYAPELITTQQELFEARRLKDIQPELYDAAIKRLKNWKLSENQIQQILNASKVVSQFPKQAQVSGYVTQKFIHVGDYVQTGEPMYEITNLNKVWALFDIYESELQWVNVGDSISFSTPSFPYKKFEGVINYIDPVIDPLTHVAKARVSLNNAELKLKPEMFISGTLNSKWREQDFISVPKSAVMWTGKRSFVYVKTPDIDETEFSLKSVVLGHSLGEEYIISSGLEEGEEIAVNGTFSIDAALQLSGKPSMMVDSSEKSSMDHHHESPIMSPKNTLNIEEVNLSSMAKSEIKSLINDYFSLKNALVSDDFTAAQLKGQIFIDGVKEIKDDMFDSSARTLWHSYSSALKKNLTHIDHFTNIEELRKEFIETSNIVKSIATSFLPTEKNIYVQYCPMANNNNGAEWLSLEKEIKNPYFGASMLMCGSIKNEIRPFSKK